MRKDNVLLLVLSVMLLIISPGGFWVLLLTGLVIKKIGGLRSPDAPFLVNLFAAGFAVRVVILMLISAAFMAKGRILFYSDYSGWTPNIIGDAAYYTLRAYWMSLDWRGFLLSDKVLLSTYNPIYGWHGYTYVLAAFHYLFGFSPVSSVLVNCCIGALNGILAFMIAKEFLDRRAAQIAGISVSFLPSLILWSITNLKDTALIFVTLVIIKSFICFIRSRGKRKVVMLAGMIAGVCVLSTLRKYTGFLMCGVLIVSYFFSLRSVAVKAVLAGLIVIAVILGAVTGSPLIKKADVGLHMAMYRLLSIHQATVPLPGSSYKILDDKYYEHNPDYQTGISPDFEYYAFPTFKLSYMEYAGIYARAMVHFLFEPFFWRSGSALMGLAAGQVVFWYLMLPFALYGLLTMCRFSFSQSSIFIVYFLGMSFFIAMTQGNAGTLFRIRDVVSPVILVWASAGLAAVMKWDVFERRTTDAVCG